MTDLLHSKTWCLHDCHPSAEEVDVVCTSFQPFHRDRFDSEVKQFTLHVKRYSFLMEKDTFAKGLVQLGPLCFIILNSFVCALAGA